MGFGCAGALLALLAATALAAAQEWQTGDRLPAFSVPTLDGTLHVDGDAAAGRSGSATQAPAPAGNQAVQRGPLLVVCYDAAHPGSRAMWRETASLDSLLKDAPRDAEFLLLPLNAVMQLSWSMPQDRNPSAFQPPSQPQRPTPARRSRRGSSPATALPAAAAGGGRKPGGARPAGAAGSNVTTNATQPAPSAPRLLAYFLEVSSFWVYERLAGLDSNLPLQLAGADCRWLPPDGSTGAGAAPQPPPALQGATALVTLSQWPSKDPAAPCSWRALLMGAARSGAAAVLFAAPPGVGSDLQQPDCEGGTEACGHPAIAAAVVGHQFGQALQLALNGSERVNVTFGGLRGPGMAAGILPDGRLFEVGAGSSATPSLAAVVWEAQGRAYLQQLEERASERAAAPGSVAVPIFSRALMPQGEGVRAAVQLPSVAQLAGLDRLELDLQLGCPGSSDKSCPEWDHVVQLFVCCEDPSGAAPPCDVCRKTPWSLSEAQAAALTPGSLSLGVMPSSSTAAGSSGSGGSSAGISTGSASVAVRAIKDGSGSALPDAQLARQCGRELGRWVSPYRRGTGRWLTDASPLLPLLVPGQTCTFTMQSTDWAGTWQPSLTLLFSNSKAGSQAQADAGSGGTSAATRSSGGGSVGGSTGRRGPNAAHSASAPAPAPAPALAAARPLPNGLRVASSGNHSMASGVTLVAGDAQAALPASVSSSEVARLLPLPWPGGMLDAAYNRRQQPFQFKTPAGVRRALLVATITGHGQDSLFNCAEFCPTEHVFSVNGAQQNVSHLAAGDLFGCADQITEGIVPNQLGTWTLGRAGWCPGGAAVPWVADITDLLLPRGEQNLLEYQALLPGGKQPGTPPDELPQDLAANATALAEELRRGSGYIMLEASLVLYTEP
ncbi:hypothetical protein COHA_007561 [Chlorella ohadii]|uniref:Peptide-N-glycosidase F N-terminal domain-containing protein n=1 Tax=Chlorella ohadii TaxID=2649997 RepID=A0AAD5DQI9_9CHLO|nr:hypothetical protein COHA_007561 [Chlorella ohadii]